MYWAGQGPTTGREQSDGYRAGTAHETDLRFARTAQRFSKLEEAMIEQQRQNPFEKNKPTCKSLLKKTSSKKKNKKKSKKSKTEDDSSDTSSSNGSFSGDSDSENEGAIEISSEDDEGDNSKGLRSKSLRHKDRHQGPWM